MVKKRINLNKEEIFYHTRIVNIAISLEENRAFWENYHFDISKENLSTIAFEERWFGNKSMMRTRSLLNDLRYRYGRFPEALELLCAWKPSEPIIRQNIIHWHFQLADPLYRQFTGDFLIVRRNYPKPFIDVESTINWISEKVSNRWGFQTKKKIANNLISSASAAGLCSNKKGKKKLKYPQLSDLSLAYLLYLLRNISYEGTILENPYFRSVGLTDSFLEKRISSLPGFNYSKVVDIKEFQWDYPDLKTWSKKVLSI